jgi:hypothetical protein
VPGTAPVRPGAAPPDGAPGHQTPPERDEEEKAGLGLAEAASGEDAEGNKQSEDDELLHGADPRPMP